MPAGSPRPEDAWSWVVYINLPWGPLRHLPMPYKWFLSYLLYLRSVSRWKRKHLGLSSWNSGRTSSHVESLGKCWRHLHMKPTHVCWGGVCPAVNRGAQSLEIYMLSHWIRNSIRTRCLLLSPQHLQESLGSSVNNYQTEEAWIFHLSGNLDKMVFK